MCLVMISFIAIAIKISSQITSLAIFLSLTSKYHSVSLNSAIQTAIKLNQAMWVSLDSTFSKGGETRIDGSRQHNKQQNVVLGTSLGFMLTPQFSGALAYTDITHEEYGSPDISTWMFRMQYAW